MAQARIRTAEAKPPITVQLTEAIDRIPLARNHLMILALIGVGTLFNAVEGYNVGYAAPLLAADWGLSGSQTAMLTTATFGGLAVGSVIAGVTGDRWGRRVTYMFSLLLFSVGGFVSAFSPDYAFLLAARVAVGIGLGGEIATALTVTSELLPTRARGAALGFINVAGGGAGIFVASGLAALILGPMSGMVGGDSMAWRVFLGILVLPALFIYYFRRYIPESPRYLAQTGRVDQANEVLTRLASGRLRPVPDAPVTPYLTETATTATGAGAGTTAPVGTSRLREIFEGTLRRRTAALWVMEIMTFGAQVAVTSMWPAILVWKGFGSDSSLTMTLVINIGSLLGAVAAALFGQLLPRRTTLAAGAVTATLVAVGFGLANARPAVIVLGIALAFLFMVLNTTVWIYTPELYPTRLRGRGTGIGTTVGLAASAVFPLVAAWLMDDFGSFGLFAVVGGMYAVMAVAALFGPETRGVPLEEVSGTSLATAGTDPRSAGGQS